MSPIARPSDTLLPPWQFLTTPPGILANSAQRPPHLLLGTELVEPPPSAMPKWSAGCSRRGTRCLRGLAGRTQRQSPFSQYSTLVMATCVPRSSYRTGPRRRKQVTSTRPPSLPACLRACLRACRKSQLPSDCRPAFPRTVDGGWAQRSGMIVLGPCATALNLLRELQTWPLHTTSD